MLAETYTGLMTNPPHLEFELTLEALTGILLYPIGRRVLSRAKARWHHEIDTEHGVTHKETGMEILDDEDRHLVDSVSIHPKDDGPKQRWWGDVLLHLWSDGTVTWEEQ